jgi:hypothetical protein
MIRVFILIVPILGSTINLKSIFRTALERSNPNGITEPDNCVDLLDAIARESTDVIVAQLSTLRSIALLRYEDVCLQLLAQREADRAAKETVVARMNRNPTLNEVVTHEELHRRLNHLNQLIEHYESFVVSSGLRYHMVVHDVFTAMKYSVIHYLRPLLHQSSSIDDVRFAYSRLRGYLTHLNDDPTIHVRAIKGALLQAYAELFTMRERISIGSL